MPSNPLAFPSVGEGFNNPLYSASGMTLRDYFAGHALVGLIHHYHEDRAVGHEPLRELTSLSYAYADEMLAAREKATV